MVERLFLAVPWGCLRFVIVVFPDHTHLLFLIFIKYLLLQNVTSIDFRENSFKRIFPMGCLAHKCDRLLASLEF